MNKTLKIILLVIFLIVGAIVGWTLFKAILGIIIFSGVVLIGWIGFEIGRFFPRKKKSKKESQ